LRNINIHRSVEERRKKTKQFKTRNLRDHPLQNYRGSSAQQKLILASHFTILFSFA